jgi:hypothetical protein
MMLEVLNVVLLEACFSAVPLQDAPAAPDYPVLELPAVASTLTWLTEAPAFVFPVMNVTTFPVKSHICNVFSSPPNKHKIQIN